MLRLLETLLARRALAPRGSAWLIAVFLSAGLLGRCMSPVHEPSTAAVRGSAQPNVIFLLADDQRHDALGASGNRLIRTPHLDQLAAEGIRFRNAFCTTSICPTSRASFLTGQYGSRHGIEDFGTPLSTAQWESTWQGTLVRRGYQSGFVGKWGLGGELPVGRFDVWQGFGGQGRYYFEDGKRVPTDRPKTPDYQDPASRDHLTSRLGNAAVAAIGVLEEPFLLQLSFKAPHAQDGSSEPFQYDPQFDDLYSDVEIPLPTTANQDAFTKLPPILQTSEGRKRWQQRFSTPEMFRDSVRGYYRLVTGIDQVVGRIRDKLTQEQLEQRTIIVFSSDNGFFLGEHGLAGKWLAYEESIRIPLILYDPRIKASARGSVVDAMALNIDVAPTLLELVGAPVPKAMQGRSLARFLEGKSPSWREDWYYEHRFERPGILFSEGVRTERWKLVRYRADGSDMEQLFDLENDPFEVNDLAGDEGQARRLAQLRQRLARLRRASR